MLSAGIDLGSKSVKCVLLDESGALLWSSYGPHRGRVREAAAQLAAQLAERAGGRPLRVALTGSGAVGLARSAGLPFVQELAAARRGVRAQGLEADAFVELGGEDAKLVYLEPPAEQRMNTSCASGTGSFLEDVAALMGVGMPELDALAAQGQARYAIASRCAVFATRDLKPLLAAGVPRADVAASVYQAVVEQTLATLACGRPVRGRVLFLGGPFAHLPALVERFSVNLQLGEGCALVPGHALLMPAWGAALHAAAVAEPLGAGELARRLDARAVQAPGAGGEAAALPALRLEGALADGGAEQLERVELAEAQPPLYLGFDAGSTTVKLAAVDAAGRLCHWAYEPAPVDALACARGMLGALEDAWARCRPARDAGPLPVERMLVCGYGEALLVEQLGAQGVLAETAAHLAGALALYPQASFVLDIGGQDMKALWVKDGQLERTVVNETCSSGCGAFMSSAALSLGLSLPELDAAALSAEHPVDLGARCTVFMRSRVRAAQEQGAAVADIAAGAAHAVARNALRRLIGPKRLGSLGERVVVQGGAFASDAVLAAFACELGRPVLRSELAPVTGAIGAACTARLQALGHARQRACEQAPNVIAFQQRLLAGYRGFDASGPRGRQRIGFAPSLNCYEALPFWHTLLRELGFSVMLPQDGGDDVPASLVSSTLPSDTVCLPAQITHRMCLQLAASGADCLLVPRSERAFHCAVSSEYALVLPDALAPVLGGLPVYTPDVLAFAPKRLMKKPEARQALFDFLRGLAPAEQELLRDEYDAALDAAWVEQQAFLARVEQAGREALAWVHARPDRHGVIACGRSYHTAPQLLDGLDELLAEQGFAVIAPIAVDAQARQARTPLVDKSHNQSIEAVWRAAKHFLGYAALAVQDPQLELVCLQSFGCGMDAVSLADVERLLEEHGKPFTLIKLDSRTDAAHTRIRLRALADSVRARELAGVQGGGFDGAALLGGAARPQGLEQAESAARRSGLHHGEHPHLDANPAAAGAGGSAAGAGERPERGVPGLPESAIFDDYLPFEGLEEADVDYAVRKLPADMCGTASLLAAYAIRRAQRHPSLQIELPDCCELCLTNAVQHLMLMEGLVNPVRWSSDPHCLPYAGARGLCSGSLQEQGGEGELVGIAGNPLLLFDARANQGLVEAAAEHGARLCFPESNSWFSDPDHYLPQLQSLYSQGARRLLWLQSFCCLKAHVHVRGQLAQLRRRFPDVEISVIDIDPQASPLNGRNRLLLALESLQE
ncbi:MAG: BadF/BadG/BcrA/BcrD ATPase family protein [Coriobacteriales bacterium]